MAVRPYVEYSPTLKGAYFYLSYNALFVQALKDHVPADYRAWDATEKVWYVGEAYSAPVIKLARSFWPDLNTAPYYAKANGGYDHARGQRQRERPAWEQASGQRQQQHDPYGFGWGRNGYTYTSPPPPMGQPQPLAVLHLLPTAPPEVVRAAYKALAMIHHPDKGGRPEAMQKLNDAMDELRKMGKA